MREYESTAIQKNEKGYSTSDQNKTIKHDEVVSY